MNMPRLHLDSNPCHSQTDAVGQPNPSKSGRLILTCSGCMRMDEKSYGSRVAWRDRCNMGRDIVARLRLGGQSGVLEAHTPLHLPFVRPCIIDYPFIFGAIQIDSASKLPPLTVS